MNRTHVKLGEVLRVKHGYAFDGEYFASEGPYVLLTPGSFNERGGFRDQADSTKYYIGDVPRGYLLDEGELLIAMTEQAPGLLGSSLLVPQPNRFLHNQRLGRIVDLDERRLIRRYAYYLFNTAAVRSQISASATGGKVRHTAPERVAKVAVSLPSIAEQRKVADILSAYDDLIENNCRRMALLEEAARQLYRQWFVRGRFPRHEHARIADGLPDGWRQVQFGDLCTDLRESLLPDQVEPDTPYIGLEHMPRRSVALASWGRAEQVTSTKLRFRAGDVLFGKIRPYFHKVGIAFIDGVASSDAIVIRSNDKLRDFVLMTASSDRFVAAISQSVREGSKMPRADWKVMKAYPVALPPDGVLAAFNSVISPVVEHLRILTFANQKLRAARDLLLPRLMSGELAV